MYKPTGRPTGRPKEDNASKPCTGCGAARDSLPKSKCKSCLAGYKRKVRAKDPSKHKAALRRWYESDVEHARELARKSYARNRDRRIKAAVEWQRANPKTRRDVIKERARHAVADAIKWRRLKKGDTCADCGSHGKKMHAHHEDYMKKLDVVWLCTSCHGRRHRKSRTYSHGN
jgi:hypothetical protein